MRVGAGEMRGHLAHPGPVELPDDERASAMA